MGIKEQLSELEIKISKGLESAYTKMIELKKLKNTPLVFTKDGKIVEMNVNNIDSNNSK